MNPLAAQSLDRLSATREKPLFSPSRRPPPTPPVEVSRESGPPPPGPPNIALFGVVIDGTDARAIIRSGASDRLARVRVGDEIEGWKITSIERRQLVLSRDDRSATFVLSNGKRAGDARPGPAKASASRPAAPQFHNQPVPYELGDPKVRRSRSQ